MNICPFLCVALTFLSFSSFPKVSSQSQNQIFKADFKLYPNLSLPGQKFQNGTNSTKLVCAQQCFNNYYCTGFRYRQGCEIIQDNSQVANFNFSYNDNGILRKRKIYWRDLSYNPLNLSIYRVEKIHGGVVVGDYIYMKATLLKHGDVRIALAEQLDYMNVTYEFRARCEFMATCTNKYVSINNCYKGYWNSSAYYNVAPYTLSVNETFEYHMLVTSHGLMTFLKNVYIYTHNPASSVRNVNYIILSANVQVEELSL